MQTPERRREYQREYYAKKRAETGSYYKETRQQYYESNKEAYAKRSKNWYSDESRKMRLREKKFGINFQSLIKNQNNKCGICDISFTDYSNVHIDHDHTTNKVRGLLCKQHNRGLGFFNDNPELLIRAAEWVRKGNENGG
jgi:hypothetical protein